MAASLSTSSELRGIPCSNLVSRASQLPLQGVEDQSEGPALQPQSRLFLEEQSGPSPLPSDPNDFQILVNILANAGSRGREQSCVQFRTYKLFIKDLRCGAIMWKEPQKLNK